MFNNIFAKKETDLDGKVFKERLEAADQAVLIDVRTAAEFASGSIKGAKNLDFMAAGFQSHVQNLDKEKTYFLYCRSGNRSGNAVALFEKLGLKAYNLVGGIGSWPA